MTAFEYILVFLLIYTGMSLVWFWKSLGTKFGKDKWYDYILCWPALVICTIIGFLGWLTERKPK